MPALAKRGPVLRWWMLIVIALLAVGVYANSIKNGFALDDTGIVERNEAVQSLHWWEIWSSNYWPSPEGAPDVLYRPLTIWSYLANQAVAPNSTAGFHGVNIALHALVSMLVAALAYRFVRNGAVALVAGVIFAVHPIHTEVVANTVGRAELLAAFWSAVMLLMFLPREGVTAKAEKRGLWHGWLVAACFMLAILSKETPLALLGGVVFIDIWRWSHWEESERPKFWNWMLRQGVRYYLPLGIAAGAYLWMRFHAVGGFMAAASLCHPIVNPLFEAGPIERIVTPFALLGKYVKLMFWPEILSSDYSYPSIVPSKNIFAPDALLGLVLVAAAGIAVFGRWKQWGKAVLVIGMLACSYALVANVLRIGTIFGERLFYWPSAFGIILVSMGLVKLWDLVAELPTKTALRWIGGVGVTAACGAMCARTIERNPDWTNNDTLAISTGRDNPSSSKACFWAGSILIASDNEEYRKIGLDLMHMAIEKREDYGMPQWELAKYYQTRQDFGESFMWLCRASRWRGGSFEVRMTLQQIKDVLKNRKVEEYMPHVEAYLKQRPNEASAYMALGLAQFAQGKLEESEKSFQHALTLDGHYLEAFAELGNVKLERGDLEGGIGMLKQYTTVCHMNPEARVQLARALMKADWEKYPSAMIEAKYNLDKAAKMALAGPHVRAAQNEFDKLKAATEAKMKARLEKAGNVRADSGTVEIVR
jgi:tetratricopeptide (TPR) repeat protein